MCRLRSLESPFNLCSSSISNISASFYRTLAWSIIIYQIMLLLMTEWSSKVILVSKSGNQFCKVMVKVMSICVAPVHETSLSYSGITRIVKGVSQFYLHTLCFICKRNEPYLHLPSQPQLVLIYRPWRDGGLSRPWCEVAPAEFWTCNLPITSPAFYHTATSDLTYEPVLEPGTRLLELGYPDSILVNK